MLRSYLCPQKESLNVVLDSNATIIDIESNIRELIIDKREVVGKNWFDAFIETTDRDKVMKVFSGLLNGETDKWKTHHNDIKCENGKHLFLDFENEVVVENEKKRVISKGVLHYQRF